MDEVHDCLQRVGIGVRKDAVAEVEDVTGKTSGLFQDLACRLDDDLGRGKADGRVKVALEGDIRADTSCCELKWHPPVDPDDVGPPRVP